MEGKYIPTHASKAKKAATRAARGMATTELDVDIHAAIPIAIVATVNMMLVEVSVRTFLFTNCPKTVDPKRQLAIKQENTVPYGVALPPNALDMAPEIAGGHCNTKMYMAASNKDCTEPTNIILGSAFTTLNASRIVGCLLCSPSDAVALSALFSFQRNDASAAPAIRKPMESSNGPVGPRTPAAAPAN